MLNRRTLLGPGGGGNLVKILLVGGEGGISGFPVKILFMKCKVNTCQNQISCASGGKQERSRIKIEKMKII